MEYDFKIDGMMCPMCQSHVNQALYKLQKPKEIFKCKSNYHKGTVKIKCENRLSKEQIEEVLAPTGYKLIGEIVEKA